MKDATKMTPRELRDLADKLEKNASLMIQPTPLETRSDYNIVSIAEHIITEMMDGTYHEDNDNAQWAYEALMEYVYGPTIWNWINEKTN